MRRSSRSSTPEAFYALQIASGSKEPDAMATVRRRPSRDRGVRRLGQEARRGPAAMPRSATTASTASSSPTVRERTTRCAGRLLPAAQPVAVPPDELAKRGPNFLEPRSRERIKSGPQRWTMVVTVANPAIRRPIRARRGRKTAASVDAGTLDRPADRGRGRRPLPRHQFRPDRAAERHADVGRSVPGRALGGLRGVLRPAHGRGKRLPAYAAGAAKP